MKYFFKKNKYINYKILLSRFLMFCIMFSWYYGLVPQFRVISPEIKTVEAGIDPSESQYIISIGPVVGSTSQGYVYATFLNPSGSGKTISISRIRMSADAINTATWASTTIRRISAVSAGTTISASDIRMKNTYSNSSIADIRYNNGTGSVTYTGGANARINQIVASGAAGAFIGRDELVFASTEKLVLQPGEGIAMMQEGAGSGANIFRLTLTWEETVDTPTAQNEYILAFPRVENAGGTNYKYHTLFNPAASGKTFLIKRISLDVDADAAVSNQNELHIMRISAASSGTSISTSDIPKKNTSSGNSVAEARHTNVTATLATAGRAIIAVHGLTAANQPQGHWEWLREGSDEYIVLQQGEGLALVGSLTGDVDQIVRMSVVWEEVSSGSTPSALSEYMTVATTTGVVASGQNYISFYNPVGSGKTAILKRLGVAVDATTTAVYATTTVQRITTAAPTGGTAIPAANITKKNTSSGNSIMDIRSGTLTVNKVGGVNSRIMSVVGPGAVGQLSGHKEVYFTDEYLILQEGEGIVLYQESVGHGGLKHKMYFEWQETTAPSSQGEYIMTIGPVLGSTATYDEYFTIFNPSGSGKTMIIKKVGIRIDAVGTAVYIPTYLKRLTTNAPTGGTLMAASDIPKKHTGTSNSIAEIRWATSTASINYENGSSTRAILAGTTPGAVPSATALQQSGYDDAAFTTYENIVLQPGQGIVLTQEATGDIDLRPKLDLEWEENASTPISLGEYMMTATSTGSATSGNVYTTFFNPTWSTKDIIIKRLGLSTDAAAAAIYATTTLRLITSSSGGFFISSSTYPRKNTSTAVSSVMEIRVNNPSVNYSGGTSARYMSRTTPAAVGQAIGSVEFTFLLGNELVLHPGEGIAMYQETVGDTDHRHFVKIVWEEDAIDLPTVTTGFASDSKGISATLSGTKIGGGVATEHGFAYSTNSNFSTGVSTTTLGVRFLNTSFSGGATSLTQNTTYYFRAYVSNQSGVSYGITRSFYTGNSTSIRRMLLFEGSKINLRNKLKVNQQ